MTPATAFRGVLVGDCRERLLELPDNSVDAVVCDPPYELGFMGKRWDASGIAYDVEMWAEVLRVLKPGGHLLAFGGSRTFHRVAVAVEDAGFELRDTIHWTYSTGFPKSHNVRKALEAGGALDAVCRSNGACHGDDPAPEHDMRPLHDTDVPAPGAARGGEGSVLLQGVSEPGAPGHRSTRAEPEAGGGEQPGVEGRSDTPSPPGELPVCAVPTSPGVGESDGTSRRVRDGAQAGDGAPVRVPADPDGVRAPRRPRSAEQRPGEPPAVPGQLEPQAVRGGPHCGGCGLPVVPEGWGTALKPAHEPIVMARKPLAGTVAANVLEWGTGALNIDACRVGTDGGCRDVGPRVGWRSESVNALGGRLNGSGSAPVEGLGRWPPNVVLTHDTRCRRTGSRRVAGDKRSSQTKGSRPSGFVKTGADSGSSTPNGVLHGDSEVGVFECVPGCPVAELDAQSGWSKSPGKVTRGAGGQHGRLSPIGAQRDVPCPSDSGGASRFFPTFEWDPIADAPPFRYVAKPSKAERNAGCDGLPEEPRRTMNDYASPSEGRSAPKSGAGALHGNAHPTVKPAALLRWLVRLVTPPGGVILDPFLGSGTTAVAAILEGFEWVGCEMTAEYLPIIEARVAWAEGEVAAGRQDRPRFAAPKPANAPPPGTPTLFDDVA